MSRIGKKVIDIPKDVTVTLNENKIIVKGKHGILERDYSSVLNVEITEDKLAITRQDDTKKVKSYHGLIRALVQNMITGVNEKFIKTWKIIKIAS